MSQEAEIQTPPGLKLLRTFRGHTSWIGRIAFSPDGQLLATPSDDETIRIWEVETGKCLHVLEGNQKALYAAVAQNSSMLAIGTSDQTVQLWDPKSGEGLGEIKALSESVCAIAIRPQGDLLASCGSYGGLRLWSLESRACVHTCSHHPSSVTCLSFSPDGLTLVSGGKDGTLRFFDAEYGEFLHGTSVKTRIHGISHDPTGRFLASCGIGPSLQIWDAKSRRLLRNLEGHSGAVVHVTFFSDGRILASKGGESDNTIRFWRPDTGECLGIVPEPASFHWLPGLAFHPHNPWLATVGSEPGTNKEEADRLIHIWEVDIDRLLGEAAARPNRNATYSSARIVLVGDSGVGKTGLGWRIAHGKFREHPSTHGQQFWLVDQLCKTRSDGANCEAVLWDLAGQPDYRLIHSLFLDDSDLALILFDPNHPTDPLHGVEFWLHQLNAAREAGHSNILCQILLVAARCDRGEGTLTREELEAFCRQRSIAGYLTTSAQEGDGVNELVERMKSLINWEEKPATVTTITFKRIKDYVLELKEDMDYQSVLVTSEELRRHFEIAGRKTGAMNPRFPQEGESRIFSTQQPDEWDITNAELLTAVSHLETHGFVKRLRNSEGEVRILLAPDLLNNLAASFVLEARRNARGLGSLEEKRLLDGAYAFSELEGLDAEDRSTLIDSTALLFLEHNICFRETNPLTGESYLVFPELINQKRPQLENGVPLTDGVSYTLSGADKNVYSSLVVLLGYTQTFLRTNQWQSEARYEMSGGQICGFRQEADREGELDLVVYHGNDVTPPVQTLFQGLLESFLARHNLTVYRFEPVVCCNGHDLNRTVAREESRAGTSFVFCPRCGDRITLRTGERIQLTEEQQIEVQAQRRIADQRNRFEQSLFQIVTYVEEKNITCPSCFISYAWGEAAHERWVEKTLATDLQKAGIEVILDRWETAIGDSLPRYVEKLEYCDRVIVVGTPEYRDKYENKNEQRGYVVAAEVDLISVRLLGTEAQKSSVLPLLRSGEKETSLPPLLQGRISADLRDIEQYFVTAFDLILDLYQIPSNHSAVADLLESLAADRY